jgi:orotidine-5'-phosphate decarboxylase
MTNSFQQSIQDQILKKNSHICVGLDSDYEKIPEFLKKDTSIHNALFAFNKALIDSTIDITPMYKLNVSFYAGYGIEGLQAMQETNAYIKSKDSEVKICADAKRSEMKRSAEMVAKEIFEQFHFDAMTATPWFGYDTLEPYQRYEGKAMFLLCHDSNPSAGEVQDLELRDGRKVYEAVTELLMTKWNASGNILVEGPLTYPSILKKIHAIAGHDQFYLVAGLGAQGGSIDDLAIFKGHRNFIVNASRSVIFASAEEDFADKARQQVMQYNKEILNVI